jgi:hypothetical protein
LYVVFSNKWEQYFKEQGRGFPNIYDIIAWAYRRKAFTEDVTIDSILSMFAKEFNIPSNIISNSFNTNAKPLEFTDSLYRESDLKTILSKYGVNISRNNIDAKKESIVASPGEISRGPFIQTLYAGLDITDYVLILQSNYYSLYGNGKAVSEINYNEKKTLQQIYYGAPGTGKSYEINRQTKGHSVIRTTFHPDSDYSTFVGAYKPIMEEEKIVYKFVKQAFLKAYLSAWKKYAEGDNSLHSSIKPQFLVIEEINRGNCAQIFGDIFQLLDRGDNNFSCYPIEVDTDIQQAIEEAFAKEGKYKLPDKFNIDGVIENYKSNYDLTLTEDIKQGHVMLLPPNLYIWATMNTSDQSLFPMDSAFKRRWNWEFVPINYVDASQFTVVFSKGKVTMKWSDIIEFINYNIMTLMHNADKQIGNRFISLPEGQTEISSDLFFNKVMFYLWSEIYKDYYEDEESIFRYEGDNISFEDIASAENRDEIIVKILKSLKGKNNKTITVTESTTSTE